MLISDVTSSGAAPVLEQLLQFSGARHKLIVNNIANKDTPDYRAMDVDPVSFQQELARAVEQRRQTTGGQVGELRLKDSGEISFAGGRLRFTPKTAGTGVLRHDRNNTDIESMMRDLSENAMVHRTATELLRREHDVLRVAITQRV